LRAFRHWWLPVAASWGSSNNRCNCPGDRGVETSAVKHCGVEVVPLAPIRNGAQLAHTDRHRHVPWLLVSDAWMATRNGNRHKLEDSPSRFLAWLCHGPGMVFSSRPLPTNRVLRMHTVGSNCPFKGSKPHWWPWCGRQTTRNGELLLDFLCLCCNSNR
jgi:hypothetical protein